MYRRPLILGGLLITTTALAVACGVRNREEADTSEHALGPDGTEFVSMTVANADCRSVVLRGTSRFKNRAFVMPQAYVAVDNRQRTLLHTIPNPGGGYTLRIGVYFPGSHTVDGPRPNTADLYQRDCTFEQIKEGVNQSLAAADKITFPEPLLVNYITATLQGVEGKALIGTPGTDVLSYAGQNAILEFPIKDEAALASVVERLRQGTQLNFDMTFSARTSDGFVSIDVDLRQAADSLAASYASSANGSGSVGPVGVAVASAQEFKMKLAQVLAATDARITLEASGDQAFNDLAQKIIDAMILQNPAVRVQPANLPPGVTPPVPPGGGPTAPPAPGPAADGGAGPVSVSAAIDIRAAVEVLRSLSTFHTELRRDSVLLQKTYTTWSVIQANYSGANVDEPEVFSDQPEGRVYSRSIAKGMTLAIIPVQKATQGLSYQTTPHFFESKAELLDADHRMAGRFANIRDYPTWIKESSGSPAYMYEESGWKPWTFVSNWSYFNWGYETSETIEGNRTIQQVSPETLDDYLNKIKIGFTSGGRIYSLKELSEAKISHGDPVDGSLDRTNIRVVIVPGANLGELTLHNSEAFENTDGVYTRRYFERHMGGYGRGQLDISYSDWEQPISAPNTRSVMKVRLIADQGTTAVLNGGQITVSGGQGVLHAPPAPPP